MDSVKKLLFLNLVLLLVAGCGKENPVVPGGEEPKPERKIVTISVTIPEEGLEVSATKVLLEQDPSDTKIIKPRWETGDKLDVNGEEFVLDSDPGTTIGRFSGPEPEPDASGKYTITLKSAKHTPADYNNQTQASDGSTGHLGYSFTLSNAPRYDEINLTKDWADAWGATMSNQAGVLRLRALLPAAISGDVQKVIFKSSSAVFNGSNTLTVTLTSAGVSSGDNILDVYASLPPIVGDPLAIPDILVQFQTSANTYDKYSHYRTLGTTIKGGSTCYLNLSCAKVDEFANAPVKSGGAWIKPADIGTSANPYLIADQHQFRRVAAHLENDGTVYFKLLEDIDMTGVSWTALNTEGNHQAVNFDGNGKTVKHLVSVAPLFGVLEGELKNLSLDNTCSFTFTQTAAANFGSMAGTLEGTLRGVTVDAPVALAAATASTELCLGGLVGFVSSEATVECCTYSGALSIPSTYTNSNFSRIGGIAGNSEGTIYGTDANHQTTFSGTISFAGRITNTGVSGDPGLCLGGIVGRNKTSGVLQYVKTTADKTISNYYESYSATIVVNSTKAVYVSLGGIAGYVTDADSLLDNCTNGASIGIHITGGGTSGNTSRFLYAGGIVGTIASAKVSMINNTGAFVAHASEGSTVDIGGVFGHCFAFGNITHVAGKRPVLNSGSIQVFNISNLAGTFRVGGIAGYSQQSLQGASSYRRPESEYCLNEGDVTFTTPSGTTTSASEVNVGGIVGKTTQHLYYWINRGNVTYSHLSTAQQDNMTLSGIVGNVFSNANRSISYLINEGNVFWDANGHPGKSYIGGIVGRCGLYSTESLMVRIYLSRNSGAVYGGAGINQTDVVSFMGGIVGHLYGNASTVYSCSNTGTVCNQSVNTSLPASASSKSGGIVGCSIGDTGNIVIYDCTVGAEGNSPAVNFQSNTIGYCGGIAGYAYKTDIGGNTDDKACHVYASCQSVSSGTYACTGAAYAGGIVGYLNMGTVEKCYFHNTVISRSGSNGSGGGGIVGRFDEGTVNDCYSYLTTLTGYAQYGGVVGLSNSANTKVLTNCHYKSGFTGSQANNVYGGTAVPGTFSGNVADL